MRRFLFKATAAAMCLMLLFSAVPALPAHAAGDGAVTYRALLVGNARYDNGQTLQAPSYDMQHIEQLLLQQNFSGHTFDPSAIVKLVNATKLQMLDTIMKQLAAQADADDITYFYYSGHGFFDGKSSYIVGVDMGLISIDELKAALDKVPGHKVVILDSCYSGGYAGRSAEGETPQGSKWKDTGEGASARKASAQDGLTAFQAGVLQPFEKQQGAGQRAAMTTADYKVIAAASPFEYSYEYQFNSRNPGAPCYGPSFVMNGEDYAGGANNYSGEFTGMLVAAAGCVAFNPVFPEIKALADADRDRRITLDELYRYLRGAVLYSTVQVYPEGDGSAVFERSDVNPDDWGEPALYDTGSGAPYSQAPVNFHLLRSQDWPAEIRIRRSLKVGDNRYADNAGAEIRNIATVPAAEQAPDGSYAAAAWDGTASDGSQAGDGWYFAEVSSGSYKYPPIPFELARGVGNFPEAAKLAMNSTFDVSLPEIGSKAWYSFTPSSDGLFRLRSTNGAVGLDPEAELFDAWGDSLAWSGDIMLPDGGNDCNFELLRYLKAGQTYYVCITLDDGSDASVSVFSRFTKLSPNNALAAVDTSVTSYTLFRPDTSGMWTIRAKGAFDDDNPGITLYDTWFDALAYGERSPESYRYLCANLEAGRTYILETPASPAPLQVAAYGPGKTPALNLPAMAALTASSGARVSIAHGYDTKYLRFTPPSAGVYRFYSDSPVEGSGRVDSYAFLLDGKGAVLASDDDVNYDGGKLQFDFAVSLRSGVTYALAVRAYVRPGQLSGANKALDFTVYAAKAGEAAQAQAVAGIAAGPGAAAALYDDDGAPSGGIGAGGLLLGWGSGQEQSYGGLTGFDFGEGQFMLRRWLPELLYAPVGAAFSSLWSVGGRFVAKEAGGGYYAWGDDEEGSRFGYLSRLDDGTNGLAGYDITGMAQGADQSTVYFLDGHTGSVYGMDGLGAVPAAVTDAGTKYVAIAASSGSFFALDSSGALRAKGTNDYGECGAGNTDEVGRLAEIDLPEPVTDFAAGADHIVALGEDGRVFAWGRNDSGSLGLGRLDRHVDAPEEVPLGGLLAAGETVVRVFAGGGCSAAATSAGRVFAWGANDRGQLGVGSTFSQASPVEVKALSPAALGAGRRVSQIAFGPESAYAVANDGSVYVSGRNDYCQLGFVSDDVRTFAALTKPDQKSSNNALLSLTLSAGRLSPSFHPDTLEYNVALPSGTALSTITAAKADSAATMTIDGKAVSSRTVNAGAGPVRVEIAVTAKSGEKRTYVIHFPQSKSSNAYLSKLSVSSGCLAPALNRSATSYSVLVPETGAASVTVTPVLEDANATFTIDGAGLKSKTVALAVNKPVTVRVAVTAQLGNKRTYSFTFTRKPLLATFSALPVYAGCACLSPGGTDRLTFRYSLSLPATVKLEVLRGNRWYTALSRTEATAGSKSLVWDGKVGGKFLPQGTYRVRITPYYAGRAGASRSMKVNILPRPSIYMSSFYPSTFAVNGRNTQRITFRWSRISDVKVEVLAYSGRSVRTIYAAKNKAPGTVTLKWDGRSDSGVLLSSGYHRLKITCGGSTLYYKFKIKR